MDGYDVHLHEEWKAGRITRRELLRRASIAGVSLAALGTALGGTAARAFTGLREKQKSQQSPV